MNEKSDLGRTVTGLTSASTFKSPTLAGLQPVEFAHPLDGHAISALQRLKKFEWAAGKFIEWQWERGQHVLHSSSSIRVTKRQLSRLYSMRQHACHVLDMPEPEFYVANGAVNAFTSGHRNPYVVIYSGLIDAMDDEELLAVVSHELGHIKCNHVLYKQMVYWLAEAGAAASITDPRVYVVRQVAMKYFEKALISWDQKSELSADRAALLVLGDLKPCVRMLLKLAGAPARLAHELDVEEFLEQARRVSDLTLDSKRAEKIRRSLVESSSHPSTVDRARQLDMWVRDGGYEAFVSMRRGAVPTE